MAYKFNPLTGRMDNIGSVTGTSTFTGVPFVISSNMSVASGSEYLIKCEPLTVDATMTIDGTLCLG